MIKNITMRDSFLEVLHIRMKEHKKIFFVTADFGSPVLDKIRDDFPERYLNVGIAEQNLVNVGTGLALEGFQVFLYAIAPFITMRCYEQIRVNISILHQVRKMNINLIGVGAGCSYVVSGPTHQCFEDIAIMRVLPNIEVISPSDSSIAATFTDYCLQNENPKYLRLDAQPLEKIYPEQPQESTQAVVRDGFCELRKGKEVALVSTGHMTHKALKIAEALALTKEIGVIDIVKFSNLDTVTLAKTLKRYRKIVSMEEGLKDRGGLDSFVQFILKEHNLSKELDFHNFGIPNTYGFQLGSREDVHEFYGLRQEQIMAKLETIL